MPDEADLEELGALAAALTGHPDTAARLLGTTLATRGARRASDEAALRGGLVQQFLRRPPAPTPAADDLPDELRAVAERVSALSPRDRAALVLVRLGGLTLGETAGLLDDTPTRLRRRLESAEASVGADQLVVQTTLEALSWRAPEPDAVARARHSAEHAARRRRGRTRVAAVALGLALLAALAVPAVRMGWPLPARPAGAWTFGLALDPPPGWTERLHVVTPHQEYLQVEDDGECTVIASLPSAPTEERRPPPADAATERLWVDGRPLRFAPTYEGVGATVWWPYADGGEVSLSCSGAADDRATVQDMAERLRFSTGDALRLPVTLDRVPDGLRVAGAGFEGESPLVALLSGRTLRQAEQSAIVAVNEEPLREGRQLAVGGTDYTLSVQNRDVRLCRGVGRLSLCVTTYAGTDGGAQGRAVRRATRLATEVAGHLRLATDPGDRSTWFDARDALPG